MKKLVALSLFVLLAAVSFGQSMPNSRRKSPHDTVAANNIKVTYGRPYKNGREIFGGLVPYKKVWRTGADEATQITFEKDCASADKPIHAGTYTLFTVPDKTSWTIILNSQLNQWGAFSYEKYKDLDVHYFNVPVKHLKDVVEQFTITPKPNGLLMEWDQTSVFLPLADKAVYPPQTIHVKKTGGK